MSQDDTRDLGTPQAGKVAPEAVALRAQPRPVTRLNRRTLAMLTGGLSVDKYIKKLTYQKMTPDSASIFCPVFSPAQAFIVKAILKRLITKIACKNHGCHVLTSHSHGFGAMASQCFIIVFLNRCPLVILLNRSAH